MTTEKLISVFTMYREYLAGYKGFTGIVPKELSHRAYDVCAHGIDEFDLLCHLMWMCDRCLAAFIPSGNEQDLQKAHRWLGYIQGELRAASHFSIMDLRDHSRS